MDERERAPRPPAGTTVVTLPAEIVYANAGQVGDQLAAAFAPGVTTIVADLTPSTFCDTSGIREMVTAQKLAAASNAEFRLVIPPGQLMRIFTVAGLDGWLSIYPNLSAALAADPARKAEHTPSAYA